MWPSFRHWVKVAFSPEMHLVLAAWEGGELVGLCVVDKHPHSTVGVLQSLAGMRLETMLETLLETMLKKMQDELKRQKTEMIGLECDEKDPLVEVLEACGWTKGEKKYESYFFDMRRFNPPWFGAAPHLPPEYDALSWDQMTPEEKEQIDRWAALDSVLLSPKEEPLERESINSLILSYRGEIAGWVETHRKNPETIRYTSLFVFSQHRKRGAPIALLAESLRRHIASGIPIAFFSLNLRDTPRSWVNFVHSRLAPWAYDRKNTFTFLKKFNLL